MINFLKYKNIYFFISSLLVLFSLIFLGIFGLNFGIDFRGGAELEVNFIESSPSISEVRKAINTKEIKDKIREITIQEINTEEGLFLIRIGEKEDITADNQKKAVLYSLKSIGEVEEIRFITISGVVGREIQGIMIIIIILSIILVISYIAFAFRKVSKPLSSWYYGIVSFIALIHNILVVLGFLAFFGYFYDVTVTIPIVAGLLIVWGYSINDNVVVFDRIRENLSKEKDKSIEKYKEIVNKSLNQTIVRSINTSLSTLFAIIFILFVGGETLKYLILVLVIGVIIGTYASIFLASPLLIVLLNYKNKNKKSKKINNKTN